MLIFDFREIGNRFYAARKHMGLTQAELAEAAGLSDRTYADIERGTVNMRMETVLKLCAVLQITPDAVLTQEPESTDKQEGEILGRLKNCTEPQRQTALRLLSVYLDSLR